MDVRHVYGGPSWVDKHFELRMGPVAGVPPAVDLILLVGYLCHASADGWVRWSDLNRFGLTHSWPAESAMDRLVARGVVESDWVGGPKFRLNSRVKIGRIPRRTVTRPEPKPAPWPTLKWNAGGRAIREG